MWPLLPTAPAAFNGKGEGSVEGNSQGPGSCLGHLKKGNQEEEEEEEEEGRKGCKIRIGGEGGGGGGKNEDV